MAKIRDSKGRLDENSGYTRLLGNSRLGHLISRVQAAVIRRGNELESFIERAVPSPVKTTVEEAQGQRQAIAAGIVPRYQVVFGHRLPPVVRQSMATRERGSTIDLVIFDHQSHHLTIVELKDGDTFDTKKASGELISMGHAGERLHQLTGYMWGIAFCSFNQTSKEAIMRGAKDRFTLDQVMTGRELCDLLSVDYDVLRREREAEQPENLRYFISEMIEIDEVRDLIRASLDAYDRRHGRRSP